MNGNKEYISIMATTTNKPDDPNSLHITYLTVVMHLMNL